MVERHLYIPAHVAAGSIKVSCTSARTWRPATGTEPGVVQKVFNVEWSDGGPHFLKLGSSELHLHEKPDPTPIGPTTSQWKLKIRKFRWPI